MNFINGDIVRFGKNVGEVVSAPVKFEDPTGQYVLYTHGSCATSISALNDKCEFVGRKASAWTGDVEGSLRDLKAFPKKCVSAFVKVASREDKDKPLSAARVGLAIASMMRPYP